ALAAVNQRISSTLELDELLRTIAESARQLTGAQFGSFWLADERTRTLVYTAGSVPQIGRDSSQLRASYDVGLIGWVARHRESLVIDDVFADSRAMNPDWWRTWGSRALPVILSWSTTSCSRFSRSATRSP